MNYILSKLYLISLCEYYYDVVYFYLFIYLFI
jgi:hypothetical protein